jgi:hypothetical protein
MVDDLQKIRAAGERVAGAIFRTRDPAGQPNTGIATKKQINPPISSRIDFGSRHFCR